VLALVMMTSPADALAAVQVNPQTLVESGRRVAARLLRLDAVVAIP
jgi:hypothetical protein